MMCCSGVDSFGFLAVSQQGFDKFHSASAWRFPPRPKPRGEISPRDQTLHPQHICNVLVVANVANNNRSRASSKVAQCVSGTKSQIKSLAPFSAAFRNRNARERRTKLWRSP